MPRTRFDQYKYNKRDGMMEMIQGRIAVGNVPMSDIADALGVSVSRAYAKMNEPSAKWPLGDLLKVCRKIGISQDEVRAQIRL